MSGCWSRTSRSFRRSSKASVPSTTSTKVRAGSRPAISRRSSTAPSVCCSTSPSMAGRGRSRYRPRSKRRPNNAQRSEVDMAKLRHIAIAAKDPDAMAEFYKKAFDFKEVRKTDGPLAYGYHLSDGTIDLAILRFKTEQLGKGLDYTGLHHFGVLVEDVGEVAEKLEGLGGRHYMDQDGHRLGGFEV